MSIFVNYELSERFRVSKLLSSVQRKTYINQVGYFVKTKNMSVYTEKSCSFFDFFKYLYSFLQHAQ